MICHLPTTSDTSDTKGIVHVLLLPIVGKDVLCTTLDPLSRTWPCHAYQRRRDLWKQCWNCEIPHCGQLHRQGWEHSEMFGFRAWVAASEPRYWFSVYCLEPNYSGRLPLYCFWTMLSLSWSQVERSIPRHHNQMAESRLNPGDDSSFHATVFLTMTDLAKLLNNFSFTVSIHIWFADYHAILLFETLSSVSLRPVHSR